MIDEAIKRLAYLCDSVPPLLHAIGEPAFSQKPAPGKWSKKQIIGHLIDSATNNHQRFVRALFEDNPAIVYEQNNWVQFSYYEAMHGSGVISFWTAYNQFLLVLLKNIPAADLERLCTTGKSHPLYFLINDYVQHLEHHLRQVLPDF